MAPDWLPMDISVALTDENEWVERYGAEFAERILPMPWRNIRITGHYDVEAEVLVADRGDARKEMMDRIEQSFPDGGKGIFWVGQNRPWR